MLVGSALKEVRKSKNMKQKHLAEACHMSQTYLSQIENNKVNPNVSVLEKLSKQLDTPLPVLMFLSLDEDDIADEKRELFRNISPAVKNFIREIFLE